jgi:hypothetical protein
VVPQDITSRDPNNVTGTLWFLTTSPRGIPSNPSLSSHRSQMASFGSTKGSFYPTFVKFHDTFQENLRLILSCVLPVFLFGKTKAGKSTLMGRLLSDKTPTEFISWVRNNQLVTRAEAEIVDGVVVGGQGDATTLVPLLKPAGPMNIVDFPGFGDPNETRDNDLVV